MTCIRWPSSQGYLELGKEWKYLAISALQMFCSTKPEMYRKGSQGTFPLAQFPFSPPTIPLSYFIGTARMFDACLVLLESCLEMKGEFFLSLSHAIQVFSEQLIGGTGTSQEFRDATNNIHKRD